MLLNTLFSFIQTLNILISLIQFIHKFKLLFLYLIVTYFINLFFPYQNFQLFLYFQHIHYYLKFIKVIILSIILTILFYYYLYIFLWILSQFIYLIKYFSSLYFCLHSYILLTNLFLYYK